MQVLVYDDDEKNMYIIKIYTVYDTFKYKLMRDVFVSAKVDIYLFVSLGD